MPTETLLLEEQPNESGCRQSNVNREVIDMAKQRLAFAKSREVDALENEKNVEEMNTKSAKSAQIKLDVAEKRLKEVKREYELAKMQVSVESKNVQRVKSMSAEMKKAAQDESNNAKKKVKEAEDMLEKAQNGCDDDSPKKNSRNNKRRKVSPQGKDKEDDECVEDDVYEGFIDNLAADEEDYKEIDVQGCGCADFNGIYKRVSKYNKLLGYQSPPFMKEGSWDEDNEYAGTYVLVNKGNEGWLFCLWKYPSGRMTNNYYGSTSISTRRDLPPKNGWKTCFEGKDPVPKLQL